MDKNNNKPSVCGLMPAKTDDDRKKSGPGEMGDSLNFTRRRFMGTFAAISGALGAAFLTSKAKTASATEFSGAPGRYGVLYDLTACVGCRSCEEACNKENELPAPKVPFDDQSVFDEVRRPTVDAYTVVNRFPNPKDPDKPLYRKIQCNHCDEPACATACPIHAYTKTPEGPVTYDVNLCFGCRYCMVACPYYVPAYDYNSALEPRISKCTMCYPRVKQGRPTACSEACPTGALTFGKRSDLLKLARERIVKNPDKYVDHIFGEFEGGGTSWLYISGVPFEHYGFPTNIQKTPMLENTKGFLSSVPLVFTIWPAFFGMLYAATQHGKNGSKNEADHKKTEEKK
ncbi:MAG: 4Fe-4S dicluster domain-containing protein [Nitrospirae bacterium]|nr:4Fe-4S dicluster domain-containing protein [Nitrospirota bacterium]